MKGTIFNTCMILFGSILGSLFKKGMPEKYHEILMQALGLAVVALGLNTVVQNMPHSKYPVLFILSLAAGSVIGSFLDLESRFDSLVSRHSNGQTAQGISTGILLFCIGTLSILGPVNAALNHDYTYLFTNGMLDGVTSTVLASGYGIGIAVCAPVLFCWQGSIYLFATLCASSISTTLLTELSIVGGILILASGINILGLRKISIMNLLPSLLIPPIVLMFL
ncbi:DUF554 domain-containing protein [Ligilactobacillus sp.]|uniref:DUF554 domain-containing protein n=1 Tax=Ligilactobacillus sp. TaxID=2767921 RepID=UPI002FE3F228